MGAKLFFDVNKILAIHVNKYITTLVEASVLRCPGLRSGDLAYSLHRMDEVIRQEWLHQVTHRAEAGCFFPLF